MIVAVVSAIALAASLVVFAFWQARQKKHWVSVAFKLAPENIELQRLLDARGRAVEDRDELIQALQNDLKRHKAALSSLQGSLPFPEDSSDASSGIRSSFRRLSSLSRAEGTGPTASEDREGHEAVPGTSSSDRGD